MSIIIKPIVTEKVTKQSEVLNQFGFVVDKKANKVQIKKAIEAAYNVQVDSVNTQVNVGKKKVRQTKKGMAIGMKPSFKKAHVTLKKGESIDFYGNV